MAQLEPSLGEPLKVTESEGPLPPSCLCSECGERGGGVCEVEGVVPSPRGSDEAVLCVSAPAHQDRATQLWVISSGTRPS